MDENLGQDLELSQNILSYLHANFQGQFASLNLLSQLGFHNLNPDQIAECQSNISYIDKLLKNLYEGIPIFSRIWKSPQTQDSKEVLLLLKYAKKELLSFAHQVEKILIEPNLVEDQEQSRLLIGAYCRYAYTHEHYIKGFIEYAKHYTLVDLESSYSALLPQAEKNIEAAHLFFDMYTGEGDVPPIFYRSLFEEGLFLPGVFRTSVHDFNRFSATYVGPFDFEMTDIPQEEAQEWRVININALTAGYWHAFTMTARDFVEWMQVGITVPRSAWFWKCLMFESAEAAPWIRFGFQPPTAREWSNQGFSSEEAVEHINRGFTNPLTAREEGKKIVDE
jgi:hypothetical protein